MRKLMEVIHQLQSGQIGPDLAKTYVSSLSKRREIDPDLAMRAASFVQRQLAEETSDEGAVWRSRNYYLNSAVHRKPLTENSRSGTGSSGDQSFNQI